MIEYHKIPSLYKRDEKGRFLIGQWSEPWMEWLADLEWYFTEKVDGTNIRVIFDELAHSEGVRFGGRTEAAQIQVKLLDALRKMFPTRLLADVFEEGPVCLYGEGYGAGIQKGGGSYREGQSFILFDVRVGDWWLRRADVEDVAEHLGIDVVPVVGCGSLNEAMAMVKRRFGSQVATPPKGQDSPEAEGLVCKPPVDLFDRRGRRIIVKVKSRDMNRAMDP